MPTAAGTLGGERRKESPGGFREEVVAQVAPVLKSRDLENLRRKQNN